MFLPLNGIISGKVIPETPEHGGIVLAEKIKHRFPIRVKQADKTGEVK